jgi:hypothetical protein
MSGSHTQRRRMRTNADACDLRVHEQQIKYRQYGYMESEMLFFFLKANQKNAISHDCNIPSPSQNKCTSRIVVKISKLVRNYIYYPYEDVIIALWEEKVEKDK